MKRVIYKKTVTKDVEEEVAECPCCGSNDIDIDNYYAGNGCDDFTGYGWVKCKNCGHEIEKKSHNIGYGDTLEGLVRSAIAQWNSQSSSFGKGNSSIKALKNEIAELKNENEELKQKIKYLESQFQLNESKFALLR